MLTILGAINWEKLYEPLQEAFETAINNILPIAAVFLTVVIVFAVYLRMTKKASH